MTPNKTGNERAGATHPTAADVLAAERDAFERFITDDGKWQNAAKRASDGAYLLMQTASAWNVWQARAALAPQEALTPKQSPLPSSGGEERGCQGGKCLHASDCAVHNEPAYPAGPCDCYLLGAEPAPDLFTSMGLPTIPAFPSVVAPPAGPLVEQYLKDGETVAECLARNHKDVDGVLSLLAKARQRIADLESVADLEAFVQGLPMPEPCRWESHEGYVYTADQLKAERRSAVMAWIGRAV